MLSLVVVLPQHPLTCDIMCSIMTAEDQFFCKFITIDEIRITCFPF